MSWESEGEDGDREEQTPGQGQPLFELPLQDPQLQMTFLVKGRKRNGTIIMVLLALMPRRCLFVISIKKVRQEG